MEHPEHDKNYDSSPLLSDKSNPKIEYLSQKYPEVDKKEERPFKPQKRIPKNARMRSDGSKTQKTEKSRSLKGTNKENLRPLSKSKPSVKATKEIKKTE